MTRLLPPSELRWKFSHENLAQSILKTKRSKKSGRIGTLAQKRAMSALELGLGINQRGYNIFIVGSSGTGRTSTIEKILAERAPKEKTSDDLVLLYNFNDRDRPLALTLPPSYGPKLKKSYELLIERVLAHLEKAFETDRFLFSKQVIEDTCKQTTDEALKAIEKEANKHSFVLSHSGAAITLTPANKNGDVLTEKEFDLLTDKQKQDLEQRAEKLELLLDESMRKVRQAEKESEDALDQLERETAAIAIAGIFESARSMWKSHKRIVAHLTDIEEDILSRIRRFTQEERTNENENNDHLKVKKGKFPDDDDDLDFEEHLFVRYKVNILVTRSKTAGAPIVFETHPTASNLIGRIEQKLRGGETVTDFTRIRAGALYKANGGYLVLESQELLRDIGAWDGLKRALKNGVIELDDPGEPGRMVAMASLRPEPVPLNLKVILIGTPEIYYALAKNDPDFQSLFKVKADFDLEIDLTDENIEKYITFIQTISKDEKLLKLNESGMASIIEQAVRLAGSNKKITCRVGEIANLVRESDYWAKKDRAKIIDGKHIKQALDSRAEREGFVEIQILDEVISKKLTIDIIGSKIGQVNALTIVDVGNYEFGIALRVTCQISSGKGEIIDIEREAEQSGIFHSKGRLIIKGLISHLFGRILPFSFSATLCMEQTYSDIDGDSASLAESCALLSALTQIPIDQSFAMTGAIDQLGNVQAVGGVNEKIEGFYKVCKVKNSKEIHTVLIPPQNANDLMLNEEIVESAKKGTFRIICVETVQEAMELLTSLSWDKGPDSILQKCIESLEHLNNIRSQKKNNWHSLNQKFDSILTL